MRIIFSALVLTAACAASATTHDFSPAAALLKSAIEEKAFPGCSVLVGDANAVLWSEAFGHFDYERTAPVTRDTIYDLASVTKVAGTTSVLMRLVAEGKLAVTDPVKKYIPEFVTAAGSDAEKLRREQITVEHLLTHTGGLSSWKPFYRTVNSYSELLEAVMKTPIEKPSGTEFRYSDMGMMLLGEIASRAGRKPLAELEQELVFGPLQMRDTLRNPSKELKGRIPPTEKIPGGEGFVHGVVHDENSRAGEGITGHAGLFSTTGDLARLAAELLRGFDGKSELFPKSVMDEFFRPRTMGEVQNRALGWMVAAAPGAKPAFSHTGFTGTSIRIDPERKLYIILLSNRVHPTRNNERISRVRSGLTEAVLQAIQSSEQHRN